MENILAQYAFMLWIILIVNNKSDWLIAGQKEIGQDSLRQGECWEEEERSQIVASKCRQAR